MFMLFPVLKMTFFSIRDGGGDTGVGAGTVRNGMTMDGIIIRVLPAGLGAYRHTGERIIETAGGVAVPGTLRISIRGIWTVIGVAAMGAMTMDGDLPIPGDIREAVLTVAMVARMVARMVVRMMVPVVARVARVVARGSMTFFIKCSRLLSCSSVDTYITHGDFWMIPKGDTLCS
jgi:hypothetical protein